MVMAGIPSSSIACMWQRRYVPCSLRRSVPSERGLQNAGWLRVETKLLADGLVPPPLLNKPFFLVFSSAPPLFPYSQDLVEENARRRKRGPLERRKLHGQPGHQGGHQKRDRSRGGCITVRFAKGAAMVGRFFASLAVGIWILSFSAYRG